MDNNYRLKNNLRMARRGSSDMTQEELAAAVGCTRQTIAALEKEKYNPSLMLALRLSNVLRVPVEELFTIEEE